MPTIEMLVSLKVPDNVAITAFNTLKRMGYKELNKLERSDYYKFKITDNEDKFKKQISNVDILVNANKHKYNFDLNNIEKNYKKINALIQDIDNGSGLLLTLKERLGFTDIKELEKGILWTMYFDKKANAKKVAVDIAKDLLMNENYQKFEIIFESD